MILRAQVPFVIGSFLTASAALFGAKNLFQAYDPSECHLDIELLIVQDVSSGADVEKQAYLADELLRLSESLHAKYPAVKMGLTTFVDKPIAYLGWSSEYGGHPDSITDWCYRKETELTDDIDSFVKLLPNVVFGAGVDVPEAQYEGILRTALDSSLGWTDAATDWFDDGTAPLRIMLLVTDSTMHLAGDGQKSLNNWANDYATEYWCTVPVISDKELCAESITLRPIIDSGEATEAELERWDYIQSVLGPRVFPPMKTHPGNLTGNDGCTEYDYPDWTYMVSVLEERKINPIYALITESDTAAYNNWKWLNDQYTDTNISSHFLYQPTFEDLSGVLDEMIGEVRDNWCEVLLPSLSTTEEVTFEGSTVIDTTTLKTDRLTTGIFTTDTAYEDYTTAAIKTSTTEEQSQTATTDVETLTADTEPAPADTDTATVDTDTATAETDTATVDTDTATAETEPAPADTDTATAETEPATVDTDTATADTETATTESETDTSQNNTSESEPEATTEESETTSSGIDRCPFDVELTIVMDVSSSEVTQSDLPIIADNILTLSKLLTAKYPALRMGLTSFVDKPVAYLGYSADFGGHPEIPTDWCYRQVSPLTQEFESLTESIRNMVIGGGADPQEAQYEGILRTALDTSLGWTNATVDWMEDGTAPLRILFMMTDNAMHLMGDGPASIEKWANEYGTQAWCDQPMIWDKELCAEAVQLRPVIDAGTANAEQLERWDYIQSILGPVHFPPMQVHPGNLTGNDGCAEYDYPDWPYVVNALEERKINPIFALFSQDDTIAAGWQWIADQYHSVSSHFLYDPPVAELSDTLERIIDEIGVYWCNALGATSHDN